ncbi:O-methyltransferase [Fusarium albosuccineum]|uniref:O-methyltransferase n=1 Tax=Fusarium albosuccineum TaxID=1237068 RepID=A0A8H4L6M6_9HYPO|nr:O-methyltransferase [Fusarium albosuccineum]
MGKLRVPSWLQSSPITNSYSPATDADQKKQKRMSLNGWTQLISKSEQPSRPSESSSAEATTTTESIAVVDKTLGASQMIQLAKKITRETEKLDKYLKDHNLPDPGFGADAPGDFPKLPDEIQRSRQEVVYATRELGTLVRGPRESVRWGIWSFMDTLSLQILNSYGIAKLVPLDEPIALAQLEAKTSLDPINLARSLRHAMTNNIFQEPTPGFVAHTAASRMLAEDASLQAWVGLNGEDLFPAAAHSLQALRAYPEATSLTRTGFNFAFDTVDKEPMFATFGKNPARAKRMGEAMASLTGGEGYEVQYFVDNYDFSEVDSVEGTFVDVGGSHGFVCVDLGKKWKKMKFVVQDLPRTIDSAPNPICAEEDVARRIMLQGHDFFTEQPVQGADGANLTLFLEQYVLTWDWPVYYFRWIFHNYSTPYAIKIIQNLIPALKPGARILINDHCLREPGSENPWDEKIMRSMDILMLAILNAQERTENEFEELFKSADERFVFKVGVMS